MNERYTEVLSKYELEFQAVKRGRGAWICDTSEGLKLLREYKGTSKRLEFEHCVLEQLKSQGHIQVDRYVRSKEEELVTSAEDGTRFILKDWYADRECNLKDRSEVLEIVEYIAHLHKSLREVTFQEEWNMGSVVSDTLDVEFERHNQELKRARTFIRNKRKKSEFELCVIHNFSMFYEQAQKAYEGMVSLMKENRSLNSYLCHGELNHHHVLVGNDEIAIVEFNKMHLGMQMMDLYHFVRKVLEKHEWDLELGKTMIKRYDQVLPFSEKERTCLYYLFLYPEKYWKQLNFYYNANKAWIPGRNIEKLKDLERQQEKRNCFLEEIKCG